MNCPHCKKEIEELIEWAPELVPYTVKLDKEGDMGTESDSNREAEAIHDMESSYCCPECGDEIAPNCTAAKKFLNQK